MAELIKYALKKGTLEIVHIDKVDNGLSCDCMCPYCRGDMEARQGNIRDHSFAHAKGVTDCGQASMTMLHLMAQKIIEEEKSIKLPIMEIYHQSGFYDSNPTYYKEKKATYERLLTQWLSKIE